MNLPAGLPVPAAAISPTDHRLLRQLPAGSLERSPGTVTRRVVPPLTPLLAIVRATRWLDGLTTASRFAAYCPRLVIVPALPEERDTALAQAAVYGIGVAVTSGSGPRVVVEPEPLPGWQPTPAGWWFTEETYRQVRPGDTHQPGTHPQLPGPTGGAL